MADQGSEGLLSPFLRAQRIGAARPHLNGKVLDFGCGSGALSEHVSSDMYVGVDTDQTSIDIARELYPSHRFELASDFSDSGFDTIISLAVIEHHSSPTRFLEELAQLLSDDVDARIICSTPNPLLDPIYHVGCKIGLFSHSADEEHEELLDRKRLNEVGENAGLIMERYKRFLFGANQLAFYRLKNEKH